MPGNHLARFLLGLLAVAGWTGVASAVAVVPNLDQRKYTIIGQDCDESSCGPPFANTSTPPAPFAPWSIPHQTSSVGSLQMSGSGTASSYSDYGWYEQDSIFDVTFLVTAPTEVHLFGLLDTYILWGAPEAGVRLTGGSVLFEHIIEDALFEDGSFDFTTVLMPGSHQLEVWADGGVPIADASFVFTFDISPEVAQIPEPSTAALMAFGLAWLARWRRR